MPAKKKPAKKPARKTVKKAVKKKPAKKRVRKVGDQLWVDSKKLSYVVIRPRTAVDAIRMVDAIESKKLNVKNRKQVEIAILKAMAQYYRVCRKLGILGLVPFRATTMECPVPSVRSLVVTAFRNAHQYLPKGP